MNFNSFFYRVLNERPYFFEIEGGNGFDIELENYKDDVYKLRDKIHDILSGKIVTDKRDVSIHIDTPEKKKTFIEFLKYDIEIKTFLKFRFGLTTEFLYTEDE